MAFRKYFKLKSFLKSIYFFLALAPQNKWILFPKNEDKLTIKQIGCVAVLESNILAANSSSNCKWQQISLA